MSISKIDPAGLDIGQIGGRRNHVYNGAFAVSQRGTSDTVAATTKYVLDRWLHEFNASGVSVTASQDTTDAPTDKGFGYAMKTTVGTAVTSGSGDVADIRQALEGQDCQFLKFGTSAAESSTISFWVRSSVTGTYCVAMRNADGGVSQVKEYTINSADTWEYKTLTFVGDTSNGIDNDNGASIFLYWDLGTGSNLQTGTTDSWVAGAVRSTSNQVDWIGTSGATFYLTGVQLEVGTVATPFEHRSYGEELALCQRYYQVVNCPGAAGSVGINFNRARDAQDVYSHTFELKTEMRSSPTASATGVAIHVPGNTANDTGATFPDVAESTPTAVALSVDLSIADPGATNQIVILNAGKVLFDSEL